MALTSLTLSVDSDNWRQFSACRDTDPDLFFPVGTTGPAIEQIESGQGRLHRVRGPPAVPRVRPHHQPGLRASGAAPPRRSAASSVVSGSPPSAGRPDPGSAPDLTPTPSRAPTTPIDRHDLPHREVVSRAGSLERRRVDRHPEPARALAGAVEAGHRAPHQVAGVVGVGDPLGGQRDPQRHPGAGPQALAVAVGHLDGAGQLGGDERPHDRQPQAGGGLDREALGQARRRRRPRRCAARDRRCPARPAPCRPGGSMPGREGVVDDVLQQLGEHDGQRGGHGAGQRARRRRRRGSASGAPARSGPPRPCAPAAARSR